MSSWGYTPNQWSYNLFYLLLTTGFWATTSSKIFHLPPWRPESELSGRSGKEWDFKHLNIFLSPELLEKMMIPIWRRRKMDFQILGWRFNNHQVKLGPGKPSKYPYFQGSLVAGLLGGFRCLKKMGHKRRSRYGNFENFPKFSKWNPCQTNKKKLRQKAVPSSSCHALENPSTTTSNREFYFTLFLNDRLKWTRGAVEQLEVQGFLFKRRGRRTCGVPPENPKSSETVGWGGWFLFRV